MNVILKTTTATITVGVVHLTTDNKIFAGEAGDWQKAESVKQVEEFVNSQICDSDYPAWEFRTPSDTYLIVAAGDARVECSTSYYFWDDQGGVWCEHDGVGSAVAAICALEEVLEEEE